MEMDENGLPEMKVQPVSLSTEVFEALQARGCGAWVDNHGCTADANTIVTGQVDLMFATYLCITDPRTGESLAFICDRHTPDPLKNLIQDARPDLLVHARGELRKLLDFEGVTYPIPNALEPEG